MEVGHLNVRPRQLAQFVSLTDHVRIEDAAKALDVTPRVLAKAIHDLERAVGEPLLRQQTRRIQLTEAGERIAESAATVLAAVDRFQAAARDHATGLGMAHVANADTLATILKECALTGHSLRLRERIAPDEQQLTDLQNHRIDVAVCSVRGRLPAGLIGRLLRWDPLVCLNLDGDFVCEAIDPCRAEIIAASYGAFWPLHDALLDGYERVARCHVARVLVPAGSGHELAAALRSAQGRTVVAPASVAGTGHQPVSGLVPIQPYLVWQIVWRRSDRSSVVQEFVDAAVDTAERLGWLEPAYPSAEPWCLTNADPGAVEDCP